MNKSTINTAMIQQVYRTYQKKYNLSLPKITSIKYVNSKNFWAQFLSEDLYNQKYILYIDNSLLVRNKKFIKQTLFHEFTHLSDSLNFLNNNYEEFKIIMISYSEFHASKREMIERIEEVEENNVNLQTNITHEGILTIQSFMDQTFVHMKNDLEKMSKNKSLEHFFYETNNIYYFYGYVSALQKFNIAYNINVHELNIIFYTNIFEIQNNLLQKDIDIKNLVALHTKLIENIQNLYTINKMIKQN